MAARLERSGFIRRERQGASAQIRLSAAGREALPRVQTLWREIDQQLSDAAGADLDDLLSGLVHIRDRLKE